MAGPEDQIVAHYETGGLYDRIMTAFAANGVAEDAITAQDLRAIDEFHIGGAGATAMLLDPLALPPGVSVLDFGSGLGGPARYMEKRYGAKVTGVDLTPDFVDCARRLSALLGQDIDFVVGSALDTPFPDASFDVCTLIHVGMNLPDKDQLFAEAARVLKPGGRFAVYDVMLFGGHPSFPLPWASSPEHSFLATPDDYITAAEAAGFALLHRADKGDVARAFFADLAKQVAGEATPAVRLPLLMGETAPQKVGNMVAAVNAGDIAPVEMVFRRGP